MLRKKGVLRNFRKFTGKHLLRPPALLNKRFWHFSYGTTPLVAASVSDPSQGNMNSKILASLHQGPFLPKATLIGWCVVAFWKNYVAIKKCGSIKPKATWWRRYDCHYDLIRVHPHRFDTENNWFLKWIRYLNSPHLCPPILQYLREADICILYIHWLFDPLIPNATKWSTHSNNLSGSADELLVVAHFAGVGC